MKLKRAIFLIVLLLMPVTLFCFQNGVSVLPKGAVATNDPKSLPLPTSGYQVYLVGEAHGNQETKAVLLGYLDQLNHKSLLRDVFLEEDQAYEEEARAFVQGELDNLPEGLCLRADILNGLREFNRGLSADKKIRVHLVDIDSPEPTIRKHLVSLKNRIGSSAAEIKIPDEELSTFTTAPLIEQLTHLTSNKGILAGLRTVRQSLILLNLGLRMYNDHTEGNPENPVREEAIAANLLDVIRAVQPDPLLGLYGYLHVQKGTRILGAFQFFPLSDRLEKAGIRVYRTVCYPFAGALMWRQQSLEFPLGPAASDFKLSNGGTIEDILKNVPDCEFFYFDLSKGIPFQAKNLLPGQRTDVIENPTKQFDSYIFLREATPMKDQCPAVRE